MAELRDRLITAGWRQGVVLAPSSLQRAGITGLDDAVGFLVLTQSCDCINPDFVKEPYLELLPLVLRKTKKGNPDPAYENGKNPREIHFWITLNGEQRCAVAHIKEIQIIDRARIEEFCFSKEMIISRECIDDIMEWRAARYSRTAFPEAFETAFRTITESFGEIMARHESDIDSLLIWISPFEEIEGNDCYEIQLLLMVTPSVMGQPETIISLEESAVEINKLFETCDALGCTECKVSNLDEMTLWKARRFLDFSRYDYLSFGQDDPTPDSP